MHASCACTLSDELNPDSVTGARLHAQSPRHRHADLWFFSLLLSGAPARRRLLTRHARRRIATPRTSPVHIPSAQHFSHGNKSACTFSHKPHMWVGRVRASEGSGATAPKPSRERLHCLEIQGARPRGPLLAPTLVTHKCPALPLASPASDPWLVAVGQLPSGCRLDSILQAGRRASLPLVDLGSTEFTLPRMRQAKNDLC